jgi:hypothetical protein
VSKIALTPNASGTGTFTLAAPNSNTSRTITLPDEAGEVLVNGTNQNVGIGTSSPAQELDVNGQVRGVDRYYFKRSSDNYSLSALARWDGSTGSPLTGTAGVNTVVGSEEASSSVILAPSNTERMRITSSGSVGIGTSSPDAKLKVTATGANLLVGYAGTQNYFDASDNIFRNFSGSEYMRINSNGNVGISTDSPAEKLHIKGTNPRIYVEGDSNSYYPSIRVTGINGGISLGTYWGGNISSQNGITFLTGSSATDSGTQRMKLTTGGGLYLGTITGLPVNGAAGVSLQPDGNVHCGVATTANANVMRFDNPNGRVGSISTTGSSTSYNTSSDYRLKTDAQPMTGASARVQALNPVNFEWIADGTRVDGFLAHEAQEVVPEAVHGTKDAMRDEEYEVTPAVLDDDGNVVTEAVMGTRSVPDYQGIDQSKLVPLLTAALQEALTEISDLKARVTALEAV